MCFRQPGRHGTQDLWRPKIGVQVSTACYRCASEAVQPNPVLSSIVVGLVTEDENITARMSCYQLANLLVIGTTGQRNERVRVVA